MTTTENLLTVQFPRRPGSFGQAIDPTVTDHVEMVWLPALPEVGSVVNAVMALPKFDRSDRTGPPRCVGFTLSPVGNGTIVWKVIPHPFNERKADDHNHLKMARYEDHIRIQGFDATTGESVNRFADINVWIEDARYPDGKTYSKGAE